MIKQFVNDVRWGDLDYLVVDTPPGNCPLCFSLLFSLSLPNILSGTSDEHMSVVESLASSNPDGAVLVTTPQVGGMFAKVLTHRRKLPWQMCERRLISV
jgi:hypothetical protein